MTSATTRGSVRPGGQFNILNQLTELSSTTTNQTVAGHTTAPTTGVGVRDAK